MDMEMGTEVGRSACCFGNVGAVAKDACITAAADWCDELIDLHTVGSNP